MAKKWGKCDYKQLQKLRDNLDKLQSADLEQFCLDTSKELAARLLALVMPDTPVGDYSKEVTVTAKRDSKRHKKGDTYTKRVTPSGKKGGTLRRGWTAGTGGGAAYAQSLPIVKEGSNYIVEIINPVEYASYVEFGHRTRDGKGWVNGQYFLTFSEETLRSLAPAVIEKKLNKLLQEAFNV